MKEVSDLTTDFMRIAEIIVKYSDGKIRLVFREKDYSNHQDEEAGHFLKLNDNRISKDIELYGQMSVNDKLGHGLPMFLLVLFNIRTDCPNSYKEGSKLLKEIGDNIFKDKILENWNRIFRLNS